MGIAGRPQGDSRFGDIRIAGYAMSSEVLAVASPFESVSGTWSGDVLINTAVDWSVGGGAGADLFSVLLHEAGHVYGLDHSTVENSTMAENYSGVRTGLSADALASFQALYGARLGDRYDAGQGNGSSSSATGCRIS